MLLALYHLLSIALTKTFTNFPPQPLARASASSPGEWLTVGEAYQVAAARGLNKSDVTFRRWLKNAITAGSIPEDLSRIGLVADFDSRRGANPNSNLVRWLRFEQ